MPAFPGHTSVRETLASYGSRCPAIDERRRTPCLVRRTPPVTGWPRALAGQCSPFGPTPLQDLQPCRVGGGALDCSRADLRPPLKLDVQFSRIQLSRRRFPLSGDGRDHRNKIDKPVLAVERAVWQSLPSATAPLAVPMRPDPSHQPLVEPVKDPPDVGPLIVVAPTSHDRIELLYQLLSANRSFAPREPSNLIFEAADRFLPGIRI